jgi:hypothetical protein
VKGFAKAQTNREINKFRTEERKNQRVQKTYFRRENVCAPLPEAILMGNKV